MEVYRRYNTAIGDYEVVKRPMKESDLMTLTIRLDEKQMEEIREVARKAKEDILKSLCEDCPYRGRLLEYGEED